MGGLGMRSRETHPQPVTEPCMVLARAGSVLESPLAVFAMLRVQLRVMLQEPHYAGLKSAGLRTQRSQLVA